MQSRMFFFVKTNSSLDDEIMLNIYKIINSKIKKMRKFMNKQFLYKLIPHRNAEWYTKYSHPQSNNYNEMQNLTLFNTNWYIVKKTFMNHKQKNMKNQTEKYSRFSVWKKNI